MRIQLVRNPLRDIVKVSVAFMRNSLALVGLTALLVAGLIVSRGPLLIQDENPLSPTLPGNESTGFLTGFTAPVSDAPEPAHDASAAAAPLDNEGRREPALASVASYTLTPAAQAGIARYLARRYHVSAPAIALMVQEAYATGREVGLDPALLLAVIGVESGFNPFAESGMGAQGLMQVMSKVHGNKFEEFGGPAAALDPVANIKIGAIILKDCIRRGGSVRDGLRLYVGSTSEEGTGYGVRVMQEKDRILLAARGGNPQILAVAVPAPKAPAAPAAAPATVAQSPAKTPEPQASAAHAHLKLAAL